MIDRLTVKDGLQQIELEGGREWEREGERERERRVEE